VAGSVDAKSQRAAWAVGDKQNRVYDTGIYNLTKQQAPVLVHTGADQTQQLLLVRIPQKQGDQQGDPSQSQ
ncbi:MAG: protocadherin, partial [Pirellulales bacterium]